MLKLIPLGLACLTILWHLALHNNSELDTYVRPKPDPLSPRNVAPGFALGYHHTTARSSEWCDKGKERRKEKPYDVLDRHFGWSNVCCWSSGTLDNSESSTYDLDEMLT